MAPAAEPAQFCFMLVRPTSESMVVGLRRDPARPRADEHLAVIVESDAAVRAINLFRDDDLSREASDFGEFLKFHHPTAPTELEGEMIAEPPSPILTLLAHLTGSAFRALSAILTPMYAQFCVCIAQMLDRAKRASASSVRA